MTRPAGKPLEHEHPSDLLTPKTDYVRGSAYPDRSPDLNARDAGGPGTWVHNPGRTAPERAAAYQEQITKAPWGNEYAIGDTHFDGVKTENGRRVLLEAKGPGKGDKIDAKGEPKPRYGGFAADVKQLDRQGDVARRHGLDLEVHVAEKPYADALREALPGRSNVQIIYTPPR